MPPQLVRLADWIMRHSTWVMLAAIELTFIALVGLPFVLSNNLLQHDLIGHLASSAFTDEFLFPAVSGYNPFYYCGAPQNLLYPPLLAYLSAALGRIIGLHLALKLLIVIAVATTPLVTYWCARAHALAPMAALLATLAVAAGLALDSRELGGNFLSTFEIGNAANALGLALFVAYAASLARLRQNPSALLLPTLLLGLNLITHLVGGIVAVALLLAHLASALAEGKPLRWLLHGAWALLLSSFFVVPLLAYQRYGSADNRSYNQYPDSLLLLLVSTGVLLAWFVSRRKDRDVLGPFALLCGLLLLMRGFVFNDWFPQGWGLHVHRFKLYDGLLLTLIFAWLADGWTAAWSSRSRARLALGTGLVAATGFVFGLLQLDTRGAATQEVPQLPRLNSRVMVVSSPLHQVSDHALQHLVPMRTGNLVGKGLFIETAANARFLLDLELLLPEDPSAVRTWGVELNPPDRVETLRPELRRLLGLFGFGYVVANEPLRRDAGLVPLKDVGAGFTLYRATDAEVAEVWTRPIVSVPSAEFLHQSELWFFSKHECLVIESAPDQSALTSFATETLTHARVTEARFSAREQSISLNVAADAPVPVLVKFTYAPQFKAYAADGQALPLYRVTPNFMLVIGHGHITLRYTRTRLERLAALVSGAALLLMLCVAAVRLGRGQLARRVHG